MISRLTIAALLCGLALTSSVSFAQDYWPTDSEWETITPTAARMNEDALRTAAEFAKANNSFSLLVLRGGKIVLEEYWFGHTVETRLSIASSNKSMMAMMVGMALDDGAFKSVDQPVVGFHPPWKNTPKEKITLRHMLSMTSGLDPKGFTAGAIKVDQFVHNSTMAWEADPGTKWKYNTPAYHMLFRLLEKATGESMEAYAEKKLFGPLGMNDTQWVKNKVGDLTNYYRVECTARDMARFGLFALRGGQWNGKQLVSPSFFKEATSPSQDLNPAYGYLWWLNSKKGRAAARASAAAFRFPGSPPDTIACMGARGQNILIVPSKDLVVVRQGTAPKERRFQPELLKMIVDSIQ